MGSVLEDNTNKRRIIIYESQAAIKAVHSMSSLDIMEQQYGTLQAVEYMYIIPV